MNLKNLLLSLALISGYVCQAASPVPIAATAILDTPPNFNGGAGAGVLTDGGGGGNNWLSTPWRDMGWTDPGYALTGGGNESGGAPPQLTFHPVGLYFVGSGTVPYM